MSKKTSKTWEIASGYGADALNDLPVLAAKVAMFMGADFNHKQAMLIVLMKETTVKLCEIIDQQREEIDTLRARVDALENQE